MTTVDLNADLGEERGDDNAMLDIVTSANIACGMHAGNLAEMTKVIDLARSKGVRVGAHPSYPDRENFGRVSMHPDLDDYKFDRMMRTQTSAFVAAADWMGYLKPHGALYNDAATIPWVTYRVARWALNHRAPVMGMPGSLIEPLAIEEGFGFIAEVFADRAYQADGTLVPRSAHGSVLHDPDEIAARVKRMVLDHTVETIDGTVYKFSAVDSVCVHGDTPGAVTIARTVRETLEAAGVTIFAPGLHNRLPVAQKPVTPK